MYNQPMSQRRSITLLAIVTAAFAFAVIAAFGSGSASAGAEARAKGAVAVPATALAYASVNADRSGAPWQALEALATKVPGGDKAIAMLNDRLNGTTEQAKLMQALGGDLSVGLLGIDLSGGTTPSADAVIVATAADSAALTSELAKAGFTKGPDLNGAPVWERGAFAITINGSTAIGATSRATLQTALGVEAGTSPALADDPAFQATLAKLPSDSIAVAYLAPARIADLAQLATTLLPKSSTKGMPDPTQALTQLSATLKDVRGLGLALHVESNGLRVIAAGDADEAALAKLGARIPTAYTPTITNQIPAEATGFVAFRDLGPSLLAVLDVAAAQSPEVAKQIVSLEKLTGISVRADLIPALTGEHALVALGGDTPSGALLLAPQDATAAATTLTKALASAKQLGAGRAEKGLTKSAVDATKIAVTVQPGGSVVAVGTAPQLAAAPTASITSSDAYQAITGQAGLPANVTGLAYINAAQLQKMAVAKGAKAVPAVGAINGIVAWGTPGAATLFISIG